MSQYSENVRNSLKPLLAPILMVFEENWFGYKEKVFEKKELDKALDSLIDDIFMILKEEKEKLHK